MHCFPGGAIEPGEDEAAAARRELSEELALDGQPQMLLWRSTTAWNMALAWWLVEVDPLAIPAANPLEVESFDWLTAGEICQLPDLLASNAEFLAAWQSGEIPRATCRDNGD